MPIPLQNTITPVVPNTVRYDVSIASRISGGRLVVAASAVLTPCRCDSVDGDEVWQSTFAEPKAWAIGDLEQYAQEVAATNPDLAQKLAAAWAANNAVIGALNAALQLA